MDFDFTRRRRLLASAARRLPAGRADPMRAAALLLLALLAATAAEARPRDQIRIVGSSTVFPYTQAVAEQFAGLTGMKAPVVESTGTGGGMQVFCGGLGPGFPDIVDASRAIKPSEQALCAANGVTDVTEIMFGYDGLTLAQALDAPDLDLSKVEIFLALAAEVPVGGKIVANPYRRWNEIDPDLPDMPIRVFGPPPTSGTRDAFVELVMEEGCAALPEMGALEPDRRAEVCQRMRQDGPFIEAGENDNLIVQRLAADPTALGIFGYSFLFENTDRLKAAAIEGAVPDADSIASGAYTVARPLFIYVKNAHRGVIPGLDAFLAEYVSEQSIGPEGYLAERGLIPLPEPERARLRARVAAAAPDRPPN